MFLFQLPFLKLGYVVIGCVSNEFSGLFASIFTVFVRSDFGIA